MWTCRVWKWAVTALLFGNRLQLVLLLILLRQLSEAGQGRVYFLNREEALGSRRERFTVVKEHPHRLRHVALPNKNKNETRELETSDLCSRTCTRTRFAAGEFPNEPAPDPAPCRPGCIGKCGWRVWRSACRWGYKRFLQRLAGATWRSSKDLRGTYLRSEEEKESVRLMSRHPTKNPKIQT